MIQFNYFNKLKNKTKDVVYINTKKSIRQKLILFCFPLFPLKLLKTINLIVILGVLIGMRLASGFLSFKIPGFNTVVSFSWLPLLVIGWFYGPVIGLFAGALTDTIGWLISGGVVWFWMYAIQEPLVAMLAGIFAGITNLRKLTKHPIADLIINQLVIFAFVIITLVIMLTLVSDGKDSLFNVVKKRDSELNDDFVNVFRYLAIAFLVFFFIVIETFILVYFFSNIKKPKSNLITFIYASTLVIMITMIFSFALGPYISVAYLKYIRVPINNFIKYGVNYYLLPRIIKESLKTPIYVFLLSTIITTFTYVFDNIKIINKNKW